MEKIEYSDTNNVLLERLKAEIPGFKAEPLTLNVPLMAVDSEGEEFSFASLRSPRTIGVDVLLRRLRLDRTKLTKRALGLLVPSSQGSFLKTDDMELAVKNLVIHYRDLCTRRTLEKTVGKTWKKYPPKVKSKPTRNSAR